mmetsp:Transcript_93009/g.272205  ORF Transcript_93009/g.272205 Transcript_93009/m.272205 type:complete len:253 (+) Transcript_93009:489-1247(+)
MKYASIHHEDGTPFRLNIDGWRQFANRTACCSCNNIVRSGDHQRAAVDLVHVLHDVNSVHEYGRLRGLQRVDGTRVLVQALRIAVGLGNVRSEAVRVTASAQQLIVQLLNHRASLNPLWIELDALCKAVTLIHQGPHDVEERGHVSQATLTLCLGLLLQPISHARALFLGHRILDQAIAPLHQVPPHLVNVFGCLWQVKVLPVAVLPTHGCVPVVALAIEAPTLGAPAALEERTRQGLVVGRGLQPRVVLEH